MVCRACLKDKDKLEFDPIVYASALALRGKSMCIDCLSKYPNPRAQREKFRRSLAANVKALALVKPPKNRQSRDAKEAFREKLIKERTPSEVEMMAHLDAAKIGYEFQKRLGAYFADFFLAEGMVVLEIDGGYHSKPSQIAKDEKRTRFMERKGLKVLRLSNAQVRHESAECLAKIKAACSGVVYARPLSALSSCSSVVAYSPRTLTSTGIR